MNASLLSPSPARARVRRGLHLVAAALAVLLPAVVWTAPSAAAGTWRPFARTSPFNVAVPAQPAVDPGSAAMVTRATRQGQVYAGLYEFGIPLYTADDATPRVAVKCLLDGVWGSCPLAGQKLPIPDRAVPSSGSDGAMVVIDSATGVAEEYWQAQRTPSGWQTSFGAVNSLTGSGWGGSSTGSGASRLGGVVRVTEVAGGSINHALALQSDNVCAVRFRAPALKTDGSSVRADCLPEGARLQLDPAVDLASIDGMTGGELAVARALQTYGGYVVDQGGAPLSVSFQRAADATPSSPGAVYASAGCSWDYYGMPHIPWSRLRVLA